MNSILPSRFRVTCKRIFQLMTSTVLLSLGIAVWSQQAFAQAEIRVRAAASNTPDITSGDITPSLEDRTDFGEGPPGATQTGFFRIYNDGDQPLILGPGALTISGPDANQFVPRVNTTLPSSVAAGEFATIGIDYVPLESPQLQIRNATVNISSNDADENPFSFAIRATTTAPTGPPDVEVLNRTGSRPVIPNGDTDPSIAKSTDFGEVLLNVTSVEGDVQMRNTGGDVLKLPSSPFTVSGPHASEFRASVSSTQGVAPGRVRLIRLTFRPQAVGLRTATVTLLSNDPDDSPYTFQVQGTGVAPPPVDSLEIVRGNNQSVDTLERFARLEVLVKDADGNPIPGGTVSFTAPTSGPSLRTSSRDVPVSTRGIAGLSARANELVGAYQVVASIDGKTATFNLENRQPETSPREIDVTSPTPSMIVNGGEFDFGTLRPGQRQFANFSINNLGTEVLTLGPDPVSISGTDAANFTLNQTGDTEVPGRGTARFSVNYVPTGTGTRTALLTIQNDDEDESPFTFTLRAETLPPTSPPEIQVFGGSNTIENGDGSPSVISQTDFGNTQLGGSLLQREFFIRNSGGDVLRISEGDVRFSGPAAADFSFARDSGSPTVELDSIPPGLQYPFSIRFRPTALGERVALLTIPNNDTNNNPFTFTIRGFATAGLAIDSGDAQTAAINSRFRQALTVRAETTRGQALAGVTINFSAPSGGASTSLSANSVVTDDSGLARVVATANNQTGSYTVAANSVGSNTVSINLSNLPDRDGDGVADIDDNCPDDENRNQSDVDGDLIGDVCDDDADNDEIPNETDNCPLVPNPDQADEKPETPEGDACEPIEELCLPIRTSNDRIALICL